MALRRFVLAIAGASLAISGALAQPADKPAQFAFWPGAQYDPAIPTLKQVVGHENGVEITAPADVVAYFRALEKAAPDRIKVFEYARSWEDRPLIYAVIGSPEYIGNLKTVKDGMAALADPRVTDETAARDLIDLLPGLAWLSYGVHGNEISSTDAAIMTAYHLLAAQNDATVNKIFDNALVAIDPMQNPDGRQRFVHNFTITRGLEPDGSAIAAERNEPWPGGRTNHYLFDMNRDWFVQTQPETKGRVAALVEWKPLVVVDAHEMGTNSTYYFAPGSPPFNAHITPTQKQNLELFGKNNAKYFDRFGFDYFTREIFDELYPGYGASWPYFYGAVGMTYEQSSARGLKARRRDGSAYDYRDTVRQHFVTSLATAETVADNRKKLLKDFYDFRASAVADGGDGDVKAYILPAATDAAGATKIAGLLSRQGVEVDKAKAAFSACGKNYDKGAYVINAAQPAERLIRNLLDADVEIDEAFLKEQERLRKKDLPDEIYDVTAWSLPLMYNVAAETCTEAPSGDFERHGGETVSPGTLSGAGAKVAYLVKWGDRPAVRFLSHAFRRGLAVKSTDKQFTHNGADYPAGSLIFPVDENPSDLADQLRAIARETGASVAGVSDSWVSAGPNFGSNNVVTMRAPKVAIAWDAPTSAYMAGNTRFVVERQFDYPVTPIRTYDIAGRDLDRFDVLILPGQTSWYGGGYDSYLGKSGKERLKSWVKAGGVLIATGGAVRILADPDNAMMSLRRENAAKEKSKKNGGDEDETTVPGTLLKSADEFEKAIAPEEEAPDGSAGVLVRALVDPDHWLAAGVSPNLNVLVRGSAIYAPLALDQGTNVSYFAGPDDVLLSGYLWEETKDQLAYKPFVAHERMGSGHLIAFTQDPTVRAYLDGLNVIFMNAVFRAPAHSGKAR